jgi:hypothetical protein
MLSTKIAMNFAIQNIVVDNSECILIQGIYLHIRGVGVDKFEVGYII